MMMKTEDLMKRIGAAQSEKETENSEADVKTVKLLIVRIGDKKYAFVSEQIREIVRDTRVYFVPFVPPYVRGIVNRHGDPYTVFDLNCLFENTALDASIFLISNFADDQIAIAISDAVEILKVPESQIRHIATTPERKDEFFSGVLNLDDADIFVIDLSLVLGRLDHDLESV